MSADPVLRELYEAEEKARMVDVAELEYAKEQGLKQGIERGIERGREQGLEQGMERGMLHGQQHLLLRLMARRIGEAPPSIVEHLQTLTHNQLDELGEALFDLNSYAEVEAWFSRPDRD